MPTKRTLTRQLAYARADREQAIEQRDDARGDAAAALGNQRRMATTLTEAQNENDRLNKQIANQPTATPEQWAAERAELRRQLDLAQRARASLVDQLTELRACNDAMSREAQDRTVAAEVTG